MLEQFDTGDVIAISNKKVVSDYGLNKLVLTIDEARHYEMEEFDLSYYFCNHEDEQLLVSVLQINGEQVIKVLYLDYSDENPNEPFFENGEMVEGFNSNLEFEDDESMELVNITVEWVESSPIFDIGELEYRDFQNENEQYLYDDGTLIRYSNNLIEFYIGNEIEEEEFELLS